VKERKRTRNLFSYVALAATLLGISNPAYAQDNKNKKLDTRIGTLEYQAGFPTRATVETLYNEMDFQRAVLAYQYVDTLVSYYSMNVAFKAAGANDGDLALWERFLDPKTIALTGNNTTIYALGFLDLEKDGPMVVEVKPGPVYGALFDLWQIPTGAVTERAAPLWWLLTTSKDRFQQGQR
jgi:hypothetical protein